MACYLESPEREPMLDLFLKYGAEINVENGLGETLIFAFINGEFYDAVDLIHELCERGASASRQNNDGFTPLHLCQPSEDMVKVLLDNDADVHIQNMYGHTNIFDYTGVRPLTNLVVTGNYDAVKLLIDHGAEPDYKLANGKTNLHSAAIYGHATIVKLLLKHGVDLGIKEHNGSTAWDMEKGKECREILARWARRHNQESQLSGRKDPDAVDEISDGSGSEN
ncbi:hypothetical protein N7517_009764 [Penicillium concentricum]|uniref:Uncharacterized protein n=1 Tax=Penicillium concentricum TaxID=293559 RepID=A0A9W9RHV3_9EURO|nr:uncharacterized protein N7517_009764 [Penicillium concentricum]KAJ5360573.1 hypothetical protein N7517_009764 [Penicillium concentricum]